MNKFKCLEISSLGKQTESHRTKSHRTKSYNFSFCIKDRTKNHNLFSLNWCNLYIGIGQKSQVFFTYLVQLVYRYRTKVTSIFYLFSATCI